MINRPRRAGAGGGVERLQMDFIGKGYGARREFNFVTNGSLHKNKSVESETYHTLMQTACDVIFTQMSVKPKYS